MQTPIRRRKWFITLAGLLFLAAAASATMVLVAPDTVQRILRGESCPEGRSKSAAPTPIEDDAPPPSTASAPPSVEPVADEDLPVILPEDVEFEGRSPLITTPAFFETTDSSGQPARRETRS